MYPVCILYVCMLCILSSIHTVYLFPEKFAVASSKHHWLETVIFSKQTVAFSSKQPRIALTLLVAGVLFLSTPRVFLNISQTV